MVSYKYENISNKNFVFHINFLLTLVLKILIFTRLDFFSFEFWLDSIDFSFYGYVLVELTLLSLIFKSYVFTFTYLYMKYIVYDFGYIRYINVYS